MKKYHHNAKKTALAAMVALALSSTGVFAAEELPVNGEVVAGQVTVGDKTYVPVGANDAKDYINPQTGQKFTVVGNSVIDWSSFDIGSGKALTFVGEGTNYLLNRVPGGNGASGIYGTLNTHNLHFILANPNGITVGNGASLNVTDGGSILLAAMSAGVNGNNVSVNNYNNGHSSVNFERGAYINGSVTAMGKTINVADGITFSGNAALKLVAGTDYSWQSITPGVDKDSIGGNGTITFSDFTDGGATNVSIGANAATVTGNMELTGDDSAVTIRTGNLTYADIYAPEITVINSGNMTVSSSKLESTVGDVRVLSGSLTNDGATLKPSFGGMFGYNPQSRVTLLNSAINAHSNAIVAGSDVSVSGKLNSSPSINATGNVLIAAGETVPLGDGDLKRAGKYNTYIEVTDADIQGKNITLAGNNDISITGESSLKATDSLNVASSGNDIAMLNGMPKNLDRSYTEDITVDDSVLQGTNINLLGGSIAVKNSANSPKTAIGTADTENVRLLAKNGLNTSGGTVQGKNVLLEGGTVEVGNGASITAAGTAGKASLLAGSTISDGTVTATSANTVTLKGTVSDGDIVLASGKVIVDGGTVDAGDKSAYLLAGNSIDTAKAQGNEAASGVMTTASGNTVTIKNGATVSGDDVHIAGYGVDLSSTTGNISKISAATTLNVVNGVTINNDGSKLVRKPAVERGRFSRDTASVVTVNESPSSALIDMPTDGNVVSGSIRYKGNDYTSESDYYFNLASGDTIATNSNSVINWNSFDIGLNGVLKFDTTSGALLNRVTGSYESWLKGKLNHTGSYPLLLVNPNGIHIYKGASINATNLLLSGLAMTNDAFSAYATSGTAAFDTTSTGAVNVETGITFANRVTDQLALVGKKVDVAENTISADSLSVNATDTANLTNLTYTGTLNGNNLLDSNGGALSISSGTYRGAANLKGTTVNMSVESHTGDMMAQGTNVTLSGGTHSGGDISLQGNSVTMSGITFDNEDKDITLAELGANGSVNVTNSTITAKDVGFTGKTVSISQLGSTPATWKVNTFTLGKGESAANSSTLSNIDLTVNKAATSPAFGTDVGLTLNKTSIKAPTINITPASLFLNTGSEIISDGSVNIQSAGALTVQSSLVEAKAGDAEVGAVGDFKVQDSTLKSDGGNLSITTDGTAIVRGNSTIDSETGDIAVQGKAIDIGYSSDTGNSFDAAGNITIKAGPEADKTSANTVSIQKTDFTTPTNASKTISLAGYDISSSGKFTTDTLNFSGTNSVNTSGNITADALNFSGHTVSAAGTISVNSLGITLDNASGASLTLGGTLNVTSALDFNGHSQATLNGIINAPTFKLTADKVTASGAAVTASNKNGDGNSIEIAATDSVTIGNSTLQTSETDGDIVVTGKSIASSGNNTATTIDSTGGNVLLMSGSETAGVYTTTEAGSISLSNTTLKGETVTAISGNTAIENSTITANTLQAAGVETINIAGWNATFADTASDTLTLSDTAVRSQNGSDAIDTVKLAGSNVTFGGGSTDASSFKANSVAVASAQRIAVNGIVDIIGADGLSLSGSDVTVNGTIQAKKIALAASAADVSLKNTSHLAASGGVAGTNTITITANAGTIAANGSMSADSITLSGKEIETGGTMSADGNVTVSATNGATNSAAITSANGDILLDSSDGSAITSNGNLSAANGSITLGHTGVNATQEITVGQASGSNTITAQNVNLNATDAITLKNIDLTVTDASGLTLSSGAVTGTEIKLTASNGDIAINSVTETGDINLTGSGKLSAENGSITIGNANSGEVMVYLENSGNSLLAKDIAIEGDAVYTSNGQFAATDGDISLLAHGTNDDYVLAANGNLVAANGAVNIMTDIGNVNVGAQFTSQEININKNSGSGDITVSSTLLAENTIGSKDGVINIGNADTQNVSVNSESVITGKLNIKGSEKIELAGGSFTVTDGTGLTLTSKDLYSIADITATNGDITLIATGEIKTYRSDTSNMQAKNITFTAGGDITSGANLKATGAAGKITAASTDGNIAVTGDMTAPAVELSAAAAGKSVEIGDGTSAANTVKTSSLTITSPTVNINKAVIDKTGDLTLTNNAITVTNATLDAGTSDISLTAASSLQVDNGILKAANITLDNVDNSTVNASGNFTASGTITLGHTGTNATADVVIGDNTGTASNRGWSAGAINVNAAANLTVKNTALIVKGDAENTLSSSNIAITGASLSADDNLTITGTNVTFSGSNTLMDKVGVTAETVTLDHAALSGPVNLTAPAVSFTNNSQVAGKLTVNAAETGGAVQLTGGVNVTGNDIQLNAAEAKIGDGSDATTITANNVSTNGKLTLNQTDVNVANNITTTAANGEIELKGAVNAGTGTMNFAAPTVKIGDGTATNVAVTAGKLTSTNDMVFNKAAVQVNIIEASGKLHFKNAINAAGKALTLSGSEVNIGDGEATTAFTAASATSTGSLTVNKAELNVPSLAANTTSGSITLIGDVTVNGDAGLALTGKNISIGNGSAATTFTAASVAGTDSLVFNKATLGVENISAVSAVDFKGAITAAGKNLQITAPTVTIGDGSTTTSITSGQVNAKAAAENGTATLNVNKASLTVGALGAKTAINFKGDVTSTVADMALDAPVTNVGNGTDAARLTAAQITSNNTLNFNKVIVNVTDIQATEAVNFQNDIITEKVLSLKAPVVNVGDGTAATSISASGVENPQIVVIGLSESAPASLNFNKAVINIADIEANGSINFANVIKAGNAGTGSLNLTAPVVNVGNGTVQAGSLQGSDSLIFNGATLTVGTIEAPIVTFQGVVNSTGALTANATTTLSTEAGSSITAAGNVNLSAAAGLNANGSSITAEGKDIVLQSTAGEVSASSNMTAANIALDSADGSQVSASGSMTATGTITLGHSDGDSATADVVIGDDTGTANTRIWSAKTVAANATDSLTIKNTALTISGNSASDLQVNTMNLAIDGAVVNGTGTAEYTFNGTNISVTGSTLDATGKVTLSGSNVGFSGTNTLTNKVAVVASTLVTANENAVLTGQVNLTAPAVSFGNDSQVAGNLTVNADATGEVLLTGAVVATGMVQLNAAQANIGDGGTTTTSITANRVAASNTLNLNQAGVSVTSTVAADEINFQNEITAASPLNLTAPVVNVGSAETAAGITGTTLTTSAELNFNNATISLDTITATDIINFKNTIKAGSSGTGSLNLNAPIVNLGDDAAGTNITASGISGNTALNVKNVTLTAGSIEAPTISFLGNAVSTGNLTAAASDTLTTMDSTISAAGNVSLNAANGLTAVGGSITATGNDITLQTATGNVSSSSDITAANITLDSADGSQISASGKMSATNKITLGHAGTNATENAVIGSSTGTAGNRNWSAKTMAVNATDSLTIKNTALTISGNSASDLQVNTMNLAIDGAVVNGTGTAEYTFNGRNISVTGSSLDATEKVTLSGGNVGFSGTNTLTDKVTVVASTKVTANENAVLNGPVNLTAPAVSFANNSQVAGKLTVNAAEADGTVQLTGHLNAAGNDVELNAGQASIGDGSTATSITADNVTADGKLTFNETTVNATNIQAAEEINFQKAITTRKSLALKAPAVNVGDGTAATSISASGVENPQIAVTGLSESALASLTFNKAVINIADIAADGSINFMNNIKAGSDGTGSLNLTAPNVNFGAADATVNITANTITGNADLSISNATLSVANMEAPTISFQGTVGSAGNLQVDATTLAIGNANIAFTGTAEAVFSGTNISVAGSSLSATNKLTLAGTGVTFSGSNTMMDKVGVTADTVTLDNAVLSGPVNLTTPAVSFTNSSQVDGKLTVNAAEAAGAVQLTGGVNVTGNDVQLNAVEAKIGDGSTTTGITANNVSTTGKLTLNQTGVNITNNITTTAANGEIELKGAVNAGTGTMNFAAPTVKIGNGTADNVAVTANTLTSNHDMVFNKAAVQVNTIEAAGKLNFKNAINADGKTLTLSGSEVNIGDSETATTFTAASATSTGSLTVNKAELNVPSLAANTTSGSITLIGNVTVNGDEGLSLTAKNISIGNGSAATTFTAESVAGTNSLVFNKATLGVENISAVSAVDFKGAIAAAGKNLQITAPTVTIGDGSTTTSITSGQVNAKAAAENGTATLNVNKASLTVGELGAKTAINFKGDVTSTVDDMALNAPVTNVGNGSDATSLIANTITSNKELNFNKATVTATNIQAAEAVNFQNAITAASALNLTAPVVNVGSNGVAAGITGTTLTTSAKLNFNNATISLGTITSTDSINFKNTIKAGSSGTESLNLNAPIVNLGDNSTGTNITASGISGNTALNVNNATLTVGGIEAPTISFLGNAVSTGSLTATASDTLTTTNSTISATGNVNLNAANGLTAAGGSITATRGNIALRNNAGEVSASGNMTAANITLDSADGSQVSASGSMTASNAITLGHSGTNATSVVAIGDAASGDRDTRVWTAGSLNIHATDNVKINKTSINLGNKPVNIQSAKLDFANSNISGKDILLVAANGYNPDTKTYTMESGNVINLTDTNLRGIDSVTLLGYKTNVKGDVATSKLLGAVGKSVTLKADGSDVESYTFEATPGANKLTIEGNVQANDNALIYIKLYGDAEFLNKDNDLQTMSFVADSPYSLDITGDMTVTAEGGIRLASDSIRVQDNLTASNPLASIELASSGGEMSITGNLQAGKDIILKSAQNIVIGTDDKTVSVTADNGSVKLLAGNFDGRYGAQGEWVSANPEVNGIDLNNTAIAAGENIIVKGGAVNFKGNNELAGDASVLAESAVLSGTVSGVANTQATLTMTADNIVVKSDTLLTMHEFATRQGNFTLETAAQIRAAETDLQGETISLANNSRVVGDAVKVKAENAELAGLIYTDKLTAKADNTLTVTETVKNKAGTDDTIVELEGSNVTFVGSSFKTLTVKGTESITLDEGDLYGEDDIALNTRNLTVTANITTANGNINLTGTDNLLVTGSLTAGQQIGLNGKNIQLRDANLNNGADAQTTVAGESAVITGTITTDTGADLSVKAQNVIVGDSGITNIAVSKFTVEGVEQAKFINTNFQADTTVKGKAAVLTGNIDATGYGLTLQSTNVTIGDGRTATAVSTKSLADADNLTIDQAVLNLDSYKLQAGKQITLKNTVTAEGQALELAAPDASIGDGSANTVIKAGSVLATDKLLVDKAVLAVDDGTLQAQQIILRGNVTADNLDLTLQAPEAAIGDGIVDTVITARSVMGTEDLLIDKASFAVTNPIIATVGNLTLQHEIVAGDTVGFQAGKAITMQGMSMDKSTDVSFEGKLIDMRDSSIDAGKDGKLFFAAYSVKTESPLSYTFQPDNEVIIDNSRLDAGEMTMLGYSIIARNGAEIYADKTLDALAAKKVAMGKLGNLEIVSQATMSNEPQNKLLQQDAIIEVGGRAYHNFRFIPASAYQSDTIMRYLESVNEMPWQIGSDNSPLSIIGIPGLSLYRFQYRDGISDAISGLEMYFTVEPHEGAVREEKEKTNE